MKLTDVRCRSQKPSDKPIRLADGGGLYLEVMSNGSKFWRQKYRYAGKEKRLPHAAYPLVSLSEAREKRDIAKKLMIEGIDPSAAKKSSKTQLSINAANTYEVVAREWVEHKKSEWTAQYATTIMNRIETDIFPAIGKLPIEGISAPILLKMLRDIEARGAYETTRRANQYCSQVFRYAIQGLVKNVSKELK